jgi:hypothetical protein
MAAEAGREAERTATGAGAVKRTLGEARVERGPGAIRAVSTPEAIRRGGPRTAPEAGTAWVPAIAPAAAPASMATPNGMPVRGTREANAR